MRFLTGFAHGHPGLMHTLLRLAAKSVVSARKHSGDFRRGGRNERASG